MRKRLSVLMQCHNFKIVLGDKRLKVLNSSHYILKFLLCSIIRLKLTLFFSVVAIKINLLKVKRVSNKVFTCLLRPAKLTICIKSVFQAKFLSVFTKRLLPTWRSILMVTQQNIVKKCKSGKNVFRLKLLTVMETV